ncbi:DUF805 domain-containing protein, partial [Ideonella sp.]|uniref:DUF805 domain-containing protein n=1 Tax=Ideonella sp. TaxID=1929293 RepID=UPI003BB65761
RLRSQAQADDGDHAPLFSLSFEGRLGRMSYFAGGVLFLSGLCVLALLVALLPGFLSVIMLIVGLVVLLVWSVRLNVLRLHDINRSGWWVLVQSVPVIGVIASLVMMLLPGDAQTNDYGDPVPERHAGLAIAALVVISLCVSYGWRQAKLAYERYADQAEAAEAQQAEDQSRTPRERIEALLGGRAATDAFYTLYARSPGHRAFASAGNGAWGMRAGANSSDEAALDALADCNGRLGQEVNTCQLVHLDDDWVVDPTR